MEKQIANDSPNSSKPICLSVRQPWAWLIVNGYKNIENRTWPTNIRGRILIHASKGMTREEFQACQIFVYGFCDLQLPRMEELERGGIVGSAVLLDCVDSHTSEWFTGPQGFVLADAKTCRFIPCKGRLGFFKPGECSVMLAELGGAL